MSKIQDIARRALPLMTPEDRREAEDLITKLTANSETFDAFKKQAADAFESDMQPVCNAVMATLKSADADALRGLRALLPHLLEEIKGEPELAAAFARQLGEALFETFTSKEQA